VKSLFSWKTSVLLLGIGGAMLLSPACKAQEVNPDHFDGRDSWAAAAQTAKPAKSRAAASTSAQAQTPKKTQGSFQLASAREAAKPANREAVAADRKRKPAGSNPKK